MQRLFPDTIFTLNIGIKLKNVDRGNTGTKTLAQEKFKNEEIKIGLWKSSKKYSSSVERDGNTVGLFKTLFTQCSGRNKGYYEEKRNRKE